MSELCDPNLSGLTLRLSGRLVRGHQVASGANGDPKFPGGSIAMQIPHFRERGLDLSGYHPATLNISISPWRYLLLGAPWSFRQVAWHPTEPAEDFSFIPAAVRPVAGGDWVDGLVYHPHPETKPAHVQPPGLIEILAKQLIPGLVYGDGMELALSPEYVAVE